MFLHQGKIKEKFWLQLRISENELYFSAASAWEIAIKARLGKLAVPGNPALYVPRRSRESGILSLPITEEHALSIAELPMHHADPFDRMLVAQAQLENLTIVTSDSAFERYDVKCMML
jgi:PIN domain nuclease of toxin-antitoxin system